jgi:hypothetical protein
MPLLFPMHAAAQVPGTQLPTHFVKLVSQICWLVALLVGPNHPVAIQQAVVTAGQGNVPHITCMHNRHSFHGFWSMSKVVVCTQADEPMCIAAAEPGFALVHCRLLLVLLTNMLQVPFVVCSAVCICC